MWSILLKFSQSAYVNKNTLEKFEYEKTTLFPSGTIFIHFNKKSTSH